MARLCISLFGSYSVTLDGHPLYEFDSDKTRLLLAYLAVEKDKPQRREYLVGLLWPEQPEARARRSLNQALYNLRQLLGEPSGRGRLRHKSDSPPRGTFLLSDTLTIQFNSNSSYVLDTQDFNNLICSCQNHNHRYLEACDECMVRLAEAGTLYRGDFLRDISVKDSVAFEEWTLLYRAHFSHKAVEALRSLALCHEYRAELSEALSVARRLVEIDPFWETGQRQLMRLLALNGQSNKALTHYDNYKHMLQSELDVTPEEETQVLSKQLTREAHTEATICRLPIPNSQLIGRKRELAELHGYLNDPDCRLLTILGPGGIGKTRLSLEIARVSRYIFSDGVFFISLSALDSTQSFAPVVAGVLEFTFREVGDPAQQLLDFLRHKNMLLVMDGFETILPGATWISEVLRYAPGVKFLVTSRSSLKISDEQVFELEGMQIPEVGELDQVKQSDAVQLFLIFAQHRQPAFILNENSCMAMVRICQLVQGLPLGLLLASYWVGLYSLDEIADQIERNLDFLKVDWKDLPARQRSLQATFEYSWNLLSKEEQRYFTSLAAFNGSFSSSAVRHVAGPSVNLLQSIIDKGLVSHTVAGRYQIHDMVRQFLFKRLEQDIKFTKVIRTRHSQYFLKSLAEWGMDIKSARQHKTLETMELEVENLRTAWRWAVIIQDWDDIASGLEGMGWYADLRFRFQEGERACQTALENLPRQNFSQLFTNLTIWQAHFLQKLGQTERAYSILLDILRRLELHPMQGSDTRPERAHTLFEIGEISLHVDRVKAREYYQESLEIFQELGDSYNTGKVLSLLGEIVHHGGEYAQAGKLLSQALPLLQAAGEPRSLASNLRWLGFNEIRQGRIAEGEPYIRQAIEVRKQIGDLSGAAQSQDDYGTVLSWRGKYREAKELFEQCLPIYEELGMHDKVAWALAILGLFSNFMSRYDEARQVGMRCVQFARQMNFPRELALGYVSLGKANIGEGKFSEAYQYLLQAIEVERSIPQSDELAFSLGHLALAELNLGKIDQARQHLCEALEIHRKTRGMFSAIICLPACAVLLARMGEVEKALEVQAMMLRYPAVANAPWYWDTCWQQINVVAQNLSQAEIQAACEHGQRFDLFTTGERLLCELSSQSRSE